MPYSINKKRRQTPGTVRFCRCRTIFLLALGLVLHMTIASGASGGVAALRMLGYSAAEREALRVGERTLSGMRLEMALRLQGSGRTEAAKQARRFERSAGNDMSGVVLRAERLPAEARRYWAFLEPLSRKQGLDPALVLAVVKAESDFNPWARSTAGATGLMQLMPGTARDLGVTEPWRAEQNLAGGTHHLASCLRRFGDKALALAAYNAGQGRVSIGGGIPPIAETRAYVARVLQWEKRFNTILSGARSG